jgi:hypothetical protein
VDLEQYLAVAPARVDSLTIGFGADTITLHIRRLDRVGLERIARAASTKRVRDPATQQWRTEIDPDRLRERIVDDALEGWDGVTYGVVARLTGRAVPTAAPDGTALPPPETPVPFTRANALAVLQHVANAETLLWSELVQAVERREAAEDDEKKTSGPTSAGT